MIALLAGIALAKPPCDPDGLRQGREALLQIEARYSTELAAAALVEACTLPPSLERALGDWSSVGPDMRRLVDARAAEDVVAWKAACTGGTDVLVATMTSLPPDQQRAALWKGCEVGRSGWVSEAEFLGADGALVSGILMLHWLQRDGIAPEHAKPLARALVGLPDPAAKPPEPLPAFLPMR